MGPLATLDFMHKMLRATPAGLLARGATALVLGCTEIPIVLNEKNTSLRIVDATDSLARRAVHWALQDVAATRTQRAELAA
jgi:aspartate racemase